MTWVKICGMTNLEDALAAVDAGADAIGFVFYEKSPRNISVEAARAIVEKLPERVEKIGVFVDSDGRHCVRVVREVGLTGTQTYFSMEGGGSAKATGASLFPKGARHLIALPIRLVLEDERIRQGASDSVNWGRDIPMTVSIPEDNMVTILLDSGDLRVPGGTGKKFDWDKAVPMAKSMRRGGVKLVVAGGLTAENVAEAMSVLEPWGVDVVSGVEEKQGKKDPAKVRAFIKAVREMDRKAN
jgi:phosphoribosylanthranilate isomerase